MHLLRWLTNFYEFRFKWTATAAIGIHPSKAWLSQLVNDKNAIWTWGHFRRTICNEICFKIATETYGMLQTAFGASCMKRASVFEWHKRFKESRESVRDDERCGKSKGVTTLESIGLIKNFKDNDRRVSIEIISEEFDVSVGTVHIIICEELKMWKICTKFVPRVLREAQKERRKLDLLLWPRDQEIEFPVEACWLSQTQEGQTEQIHPQTFDDPFFWQHWHDLHPLGSHWTESQQGLLCWGFKRVQEEIPLEKASTLQIGSVALPPEQCTSPQIHPCHRLFDKDGHLDSSSPSL